VRLVYVLTEVGLGLSSCALPLPTPVPYFRLNGQDREDRTSGRHWKLRSLYMKSRLRRKPGNQQYTGMQSPKHHITNQQTTAPAQGLCRSPQPVARAPKLRRSPADRSMAVQGAVSCVRRSNRFGVLEFCGTVVTGRTDKSSGLGLKRASSARHGGNKTSGESRRGRGRGREDVPKVLAFAPLSLGGFCAPAAPGLLPDSQSWGDADHVGNAGHGMNGVSRAHVHAYRTAQYRCNFVPPPQAPACLFRVTRSSRLRSACVRPHLIVCPWPGAIRLFCMRVR
jgi:hypothetical protein